MTDFSDYTPGPECLAARERLLETVMATWRQPSPPKPAVPKQVSFSDDIRGALVVLIKRYATHVVQAQASERGMIEARTTLPNNYWLPRRQAELRLRTSVAMLDAVLES